MANQTLFSVDANGHPVNALAPFSGSDVILSSGGAVVLALNTERNRIIELLATEADVYIGVGTTATYPKRLMQGIAQSFKLPAGQHLYAKGSGSLNIVEMG